tara:strand:- start:191 stop:430 length:240 start_codon:yes stop_codon:yes gene_type:complete
MDLIQDILYQELHKKTQNPIQSRYVAYRLSDIEQVTSIDEVRLIDADKRQYLVKTNKGSYKIELCDIDIPNTKIQYLID